MGEQRILVAKFGAAQGVRGEVRLFAFMDDPRLIGKLGLLENESGTRKFRIVSSRPGKDLLIVGVEGVSDRNAAEKLTNLELYVPRERLPAQKDKNTFYQSDLIGLRAEDREGKILGEIVALQNFGAGDLLEIRPVESAETFLLPFIDQYVPLVDVAGGRIVIAMPEGLLGGDEEDEAPGRSAR